MGGGVGQVQRPAAEAGDRPPGRATTGDVQDVRDGYDASARATSTPSPARHGVPAVLGGSALAHDTATMPGGPQSSTNVHTFRIVDGLVAEVVSHPADGYGSDAALGTAVTLPDARTPAGPVRT